MIYDSFVKDEKWQEIVALRAAYNPRSKDWAESAIQLIGHRVPYNLEPCGLFEVYDALDRALHKRENELRVENNKRFDAHIQSIKDKNVATTQEASNASRIKTGT